MAVDGSHSRLAEFSSAEFTTAARSGGCPHRLIRDWYLLGTSASAQPGLYSRIL